MLHANNNYTAGAPVVVLNKREQTAMYEDIERELQALGTPPTLDTLRDDGMLSDDTPVNRWIYAIDGFGRVARLLTAELAQSVGVFVIALFFAVLEYDRVYHGATLALNLSVDSARLVAVSFVTANFIMPMYLLREYRNLQAQGRTVTQHSVLSGLSQLLKRFYGAPVTKTVSWSYNPTLKLVKHAVTYTTILFAVYDLAIPIIDTMTTGTATDTGLNMLVKLVIGLGASIAGVYFLQSASFEIGLQAMANRPVSNEHVLRRERARYTERVEQIKSEVKAKHELAKLATMTTSDDDTGTIVTSSQRMTSDTTTGAPVNPTLPVTSTATTHTDGQMNGHTNGNGKRA